jgi:hypothetical protein
MPSNDITFCSSAGCRRRAECWRGVCPVNPVRPVSTINFRAIWGDNCGGFIPMPVPLPSGCSVVVLEVLA